jgi:CheY-like chemotaxis protein
VTAFECVRRIKRAYDLDSVERNDGLATQIVSLEEALHGRWQLHSPGRETDEYDAIALDLCECLDQAGASVVGPACSVKDALSVLESGGAPDAAVLDIELEGEPVYVVADRLQQLGVPYLFTTGYESTEIPDRYKLAPRFEKPVGVGAILDAIREQMTPRS